MSETSLPARDMSDIPDCKEIVGEGEQTSSTDIEKSSQDHPSTANPTAVDTEITYPEGGRDAWLVVFGAWCGLTASLGIYNTVGVFEAVVSNVVLPNDAPSTLGWIFSVYAFVNWVCGVQIGPTFDAMGPRALIMAGTICMLAGIFALSVCTEYYQIFLSFSILTGIGSSLLLTPSMGCVAHWFMERRGLASGIAFIGGGFGGVLFPLMIQSLLPQVGWGWSIRILAFVLLVLCAISVAFCRSRVPPRKGTETTWRDTLPDHKIFLDGTGAMALTTAGVLLTDLAYFIPITYVPSYYIDRQNLPQGEALTGSSAFAYQLLAILNAASCVGRYVAGDLADRFGRYNTMIVSLFFCTVSVLCFWLPDILIADLDSMALLVVFVLLFGFFSGSNVSLTPICLGQLCETQEYGRYYASCFTVVAFGVLASLPIGGGLLDAVAAVGKERYWGTALFAGLSYVGAFSSFLWVRIRIKGWDWRTKW
ncbi:MFS general substrate transporter [Aspergillus sclerotiicarbonarius CBS 121057]|uniref:MFS general substrate transporter n=1 Tax=Aspergillus sclerotiicarbonarius (strain CBS 121057 / IBT 28362) TaxID=1448318 RepID=A0A319EK99_ASPSB|nr:MFS general substrate transporter [Aspergillus sclerotiicarbonarius CBS 121057]